MAQSVELHTGRLRALYQDGRLRYIRFGDVEILRHVYVGVRDRWWNTIPIRIVKESVRTSHDGFLVEFLAEHREGDIDFRWAGSLRGAGDRIECVMDGMAHSSFLSNRIGWCVLHPIRECSGRECVIEHTSGETERSRFPGVVSPHQPFFDIHAMTHEPVPGLAARVEFTGDVFETEDQRNWTDASFKTYSTPLSIPFPISVQPGHTVRQSVTLTVTGNAVPVVSGGIVVTLGPESFPVPAIGYGSLAAARLKPAHLRVDVRGIDWRDRLRAAVRTGLPLELAVHNGQFEAVRRAVDDSPVARWIVYSGDTESARGDAPVGAGSDSCFAEVNRNRSMIEGRDFVAFAANPQAHLPDQLTIIENLPAIGDAVRSAVAFADGKPVVVSPLTFRRRYSPTDGPPEPTDPRLREPVAAAWVTGALKHLAEAGAASVTLFAPDELDPHSPIFDVLADIADFAPERIERSECSKPLEAVALSMLHGARRRVLLANLTDSEKEVQMGARTLRLDPWEVARVEDDEA